MKLKSFDNNSTAKTVGFAVASLALGLLVTAPAQASTFTRTSLTSAGALPGTVSDVGGLVLDLIGTNGNRVVTQAAANNLFQGSQPSTPTLVIGTQTGFDAATIAALGGGISEASIRVSLFDGDSAAGDFDVNQNTLLLNDINFGNFTSVQAQNTDGDGLALAAGLSGGGFRNNLLDTGFFFSNNATTLSQLYASLSSGSVVYKLRDESPGLPINQFYDFAQGISSAQVNIGSGPIVTPSNGGAGGAEVPEPFTIVGTLVGGTAALRMRKKLKSNDKV